MTDIGVQAIERFLSRARLDRYLASSDGDLTAAIRLYAWNIEVSATFLGPLNCLEVVLRNALHQELVTLVGVEFWWNDHRIQLIKPGRDVLDAVVRRLGRRVPPVSAGHIVSELTFGFWVGLLGRGHNYEMRLWRPALRKAFPHYHGNRADLHRELDHLRTFRNRIAHYEAIYHRHLSADHASILRIIGHISPEVADWVRRTDRVDAVLARRAEVCAGTAMATF
ncbi:MAG TPA: hypothetical protein VF163_09735 [Micromonosporaceae bacterium]